MIVVEYPVALVLKGWHLLLTAAGIGADSAWLIALVLLVITVRAALLPLYYRQIRSGRILANLRPQIRELEADYADKHDPASRKELIAKRKDIHKANNYSMADGCMPMLILVPVIMGLYRLLIRIARPAEGLEAEHAGFGPLSSSDIDSFLRAEFAGVPLPAYVRMSSEQLSELGTTSADVLHVVVPMAIAASIFTTANWAYTMRRNLRTLDYGSGAARFMLRVMWCIGPLIMLSPFLVTFGGPGPVAILVYWVCNNLWTTTQAIAVQKYLDRTMPYTPEFEEFTRSAKAELVERRQTVKTAKRHFNERQMDRAVRLSQPTLAEREREELERESAEERRELEQLVKGPKLERQRRRRARREERRKQMAEARSQRAQKKVPEAGREQGAGEGRVQDQQRAAARPAKSRKKGGRHRAGPGRAPFRPPAQGRRHAK